MFNIVTLPAILIALLLSVALVVSIVLLCRTLLRREHQRAQQLARRRWRLVATLTEELRAPNLSSARAQILKDDLFFLARAETGPVLGRVRLREVLQASLSHCGPALEQSGYQLRSHEGGDPQVAADAETLAYAVDKLLRLPQPSVGETPLIQIQLTVTRTTVALEITGGGFVQQSVAIAQRIVETQGGELRFEGRAVTIRLPLLS